MTNRQHNPLLGRGIVGGSVLILAGASLALQQVGYLHFLDLTRTWPIILIVFALVRLGSTLNTPRQRGWGLLLLGDWLFANTMTGWALAQITWPIILAGVGVLMIRRAMLHERIQEHVQLAAGQMRGNHFAA